jgi:type I restriction enzyme, S subunit
VYCALKLSRFLNATETRQALRAKATGTSGNMPKINGDAVRSLLVSVPPLHEQRRIVAKLEALQARSRRAREALDAVPPLLEKLRQSILAAAFRGDLTTDWRAKHKDVEPAGELLKRIRVERRRTWEEAEFAKMRARGKAAGDDSWKAKYKEPTEVDGTVLPELPEGWCWANTDELFSFVTSGSRGWAEYYAEDGPCFLRIGNLDHDGIDLDLSDVQHVRPPAGAEGERTRVRARDILVSITADLGMIAVVPEQLGTAYVNQHIALARPTASVPASYVGLYLSAPRDGKRLLLRANRGMTKAGLGLDDIRSVPVPLAPQDEAVVIVDSALSAVRAIRRFHAQVGARGQDIDQLGRSILAKAFRGELVPQDPNDEPAEAMLQRAEAAAAMSPGRAARRIVA